MDTKQEADILYNLELELDEENTINIVIRENDDIEEVINKFCEEHNYNEEIKQIIMNHLVECIDNDIDKFSENTTVNAWESDEEYESIMNNKVENILNVKNSSQDNSRYIEDNSSNELFNLAKGEIKKKINFKSGLPEDIENSMSLKNVNMQRSKFNASEEFLENESLELRPSTDSDKKYEYKITNKNDSVIDSQPMNSQIYYKNNVIADDSASKLDVQTGNSFSNFAIEKAKAKSKSKETIHKNSNNKIITNICDTSTERNQIPSINYKNSKEKTFNSKKSNDYSIYRDALPGERLYLQYVEKLPKKKEEHQKIREEKENEEIKEASFKPKILKSSQRMASKSPDRIKSQKIEDLLIHKGNILKEKIIEESAKKNLQEFENFSFFPKIGEKSNIIATIKRKERLEKLSKIESKNRLNKSCDISGRDLSESIPSDEEKMINNYGSNEMKDLQRVEKKFKTNNYTNSNFYIGSINRNEIAGVNSNNHLKNSFVSSDYTFTNMKLNPNAKNERKLDLNNNDKKYAQKNKIDLSLEKERNHTFNTSQNDLTIRTPHSHHSGSRSYTNSPLRDFEKKGKMFHNYHKDRMKFTPNPDTPIYLAKKQTTISNKNEEKDKNRSKTPTSTANYPPNTPVLNPHKNIHDFLYVEKELIKQRKEENESRHMKEFFPFQPTIPESSKKLVNRMETTSQFINRLMNSKKEAEELIVVKKKKNSLKSQIDPKTGKQFFKPTVSRGPLNAEKDRRVNDNLEGFYDHKILSEKKKIQDEEMLNNLEKKKLWLERSMKSVLKMKIEKYKEIFDSLDSDKDGFISSRQIRLSALDSEMLTTMTPLLEELQKRGIKMNFKEFCLAVDKFLPIRIFSNQRK